MSEQKKSICRVVHNKNYTVINNHICKDNTISYKAKGIWLYAFSRPDDWQFYESDIVNHSNEKKDSIKSGLKELENAGYLVKERRTNEKHQFVGWSYTFYEIPVEIQKKFPKAEKPDVGKTQDREKPPLLSTDILLSTEEQQQPPIGGCDVVVFDDLLKSTGLNKEEQRSIRSYMNRSKLKPEDLAKAIDFVKRPDFVINKTLVKAIMWALKEKPKLPDPVDDKKNREMAEAAEYILVSNSWNLETLSSKVIITSKTPNNSTTYEINLSDPNFKYKLDQTLKQCGFRSGLKKRKYD